MVGPVAAEYFPLSMKTSDNEPIFVVGEGRSGTTLVTSLLSAHSRITIPPETHFFARAAKEGDLDGGPRDFDAFWNEFIAWSRFQDLEIDPARCRAAIGEEGDFSFRAIFHAVLETYRQKAGKPRVGEKTPGHLAFVPTIFEWYPKAKVLIVQRDPRSVIASQLACPWVKVTPVNLRQGVFVNSRFSQIAAYAARWQHSYEQDAPRYVRDSRVMLIRYEDLVAETERVMRQVCQFLEEVYEPTMLDRDKERAVSVPVGSAQHYGGSWGGWLSEHHEKASKPVNTASVSKWKQQLRPHEVAMIEGVCKHGMEKAGYALSTRPITRGAGWVESGVVRACESAEVMARRSVRKLIRGG